MKTRIVNSSLAFVSLLACATGIAQTAPPQVSLTPLPLPAGADASEYFIAGIDAAGDVLGTVKINSRYEAVEWLGGKTPVILPRLPADQNDPNIDYVAMAINKTGAMLASASSTDPGNRAPGVYWDASRHPVAVNKSGSVFGLSDTGAITGWIAGPSNPSSFVPEIGARWTSASAQPVTLPYAIPPHCNGDCDYSGGPISPNGRYIVGLYTPPFGPNHDTAIYADGVPDGRFIDEDLRVAQITDAEVLIGSRNSGIEEPVEDNFIYEATRWEAGVYTDFPQLPGAAPGTVLDSYAHSMNASGLVVGFCQSPPRGISHAVMWIQGEIFDLHTLFASQLPAGAIALDAFALNDSGQYIVAVQDPNGPIEYYVAKPLIPTHTTITSNINPSTYGQQIHLVAKVTPDSGPVPTTGSVSWYDNGVLLGTARLTAIGTSSWEPSTWSGGVHNVTAVFPASTTLASSTSLVFKQTVNAATTRTTVSASPSPATHGQSVKLTATVVPASGTIAGTVTFKSGSTVLGTGTLDARTKQTSLTTTFAKGNYAITASFAGSQNFVASSSSTFTLTVQ